MKFELDPSRPYIDPETDDECWTFATLTGTPEEGERLAEGIVGYQVKVALLDAEDATVEKAKRRLREALA